jgi:hypothetical protein
MGAFVENVHLASEQLGMRAVVEPGLAGDDGSLACRVRFCPSLDEPTDTALFQQIAHRTTNRKTAQRMPMMQDHKARLMRVCEARGGQLTLLDDPAQLAGVAEVLGRGDWLRYTSTVMHGELLEELRWTPEEVEQTRDGVDVATLELSALDRVGLELTCSEGVMALVRDLGGGRGLETASRDAIAASSAVGLVSIPRKQGAGAMLSGGRALQRVWLEAQALGYAFQPMTALVCLFWRLLDGGLGLSDQQRCELEALRAAYCKLFDVPADTAEIMLFRLGRAEPPSARSLRRPVKDVLTFRS